MAESEVGEPRGILNRKAGEAKFDLSRLAPSSGLDYFVEHFWCVTWDLRGQKPYVSETLPHPSIHVVIEKSRSYVLGVMTGKFTRRLRDRGKVFGIKFRPGAFYPFLGAPVSEITNRSLSLRAVFGPGSTAFKRAIQAEPDPRGCARLAEALLSERLPERDPAIDLVRQVVENIANDEAVTRVEQVVSAAKVNRRVLQRLFRNYVGVSPKWVIQRYRLHEAADQLAGGSAVKMSDLALRLGYFDQAHFIRDFKAIVGKSPGEYLKGSGAVISQLEEGGIR